MTEKDELYLLQTTEDGDVSLRLVTPESLAEFPDGSKWWDRARVGGAVYDLAGTECLILIKGRIVVPKAKSVVTEYEVE